MSLHWIHAKSCFKCRGTGQWSSNRRRNDFAISGRLGSRIPVFTQRHGSHTILYPKINSFSCLDSADGHRIARIPQWAPYDKNSCQTPDTPQHLEMGYLKLSNTRSVRTYLSTASHHTLGHHCEKYSATVRCDAWKESALQHGIIVTYVWHREWTEMDKSVKQTGMCAAWMSSHTQSMSARTNWKYWCTREYWILMSVNALH